MHELSVAQNIVDVVQQHLPENWSGEIQSVKIRVGRLSGVIPESLEFCFSVIVGDTPLRGAELAIEQVPTRCRCTQCEETFSVDDVAFLCPSCGSPNVEVVSGTELQVVEVEVVDEPREKGG